MLHIPTEQQQQQDKGGGIDFTYTMYVYACMSVYVL